MNKVLVYGLGLTGISTVKTLDKLAYDVYTYDKNKKEIDELKGYNYSPISDSKLTSLPFKYVVKSPGIKPKDKISQKLSKKYKLISDIELSEILFPEKEKIAITGTNGKTSTTSMVAHILNESNIRAYPVGNIGEGILRQMHKNDGVFVEELSSFQLHDIYTYRPHIACILNIKEDHIDWHENFKDYINSKLNISKNQSKEDYLVINHDDRILKNARNTFEASIYEFSSKGKVSKGLFLKDSKIYLNDDSYKDYFIIDVADLPIIGIHNYENAMAAMLLSYLYGLDIENIVKNIKTFKPIAHRLEFVKTIRGIDFYNDSKGTNVDSSVKAIESFKSPLVVIAGGYDKKIDYSDFVKAFKNNGKLMVLIGETKDKLEDLAKKEEVAYKKAENMEEAVYLAYENASEGDVVLLSPASASWDMYKSYEERGEHFKKLVKGLDDD